MADEPAIDRPETDEPPYEAPAAMDVPADDPLSTAPVIAS